mmetsp:Transcript_3842/g.10822  ORF Transcript_3842/g.10822 Transcript_3842/m.10822 type:complete len:211 (-) Transcript_3842:1100-1732(-)
MPIYGPPRQAGGETARVRWSIRPVPVHRWAQALGVCGRQGVDLLYQALAEVAEGVQRLPHLPRAGQGLRKALRSGAEERGRPLRVAARGGGLGPARAAPARGQRERAGPPARRGPRVLREAPRGGRARGEPHGARNPARGRPVRRRGARGRALLPGDRRGHEVVRGLPVTRAGCGGREAPPACRLVNCPFSVSTRVSTETAGGSTSTSDR